MNESSAEDSSPSTVETQDRRLFLQGMGKWSGAAIVAAVAGTVVGSAPEAQAGAWVNRRGGGWVNRGGGWVNRGGGGSWVNRSGGGGWVNRRTGGGSWINRR